MAAPTQIFTHIGTEIEGLLQAFYVAAASSVAGAIGVIAISSVTMYVAIYGGMVVAGKIQQPFEDFAVKAIKIIIVAAVALNAGNYMSYVVGAVQGLEDGMVSAMNVDGGGGATIYASLDGAINKANELMEQMNKEGSDLGITQIGRAISIALCICVVGIGTIIFLFFAGAVTILAKFMLAMLFAVGPLFVLSLMWPSTAGFFDRWLGQCLTAVFTLIFLAVLVNMGVSIFDRLLTSAQVTFANPDGGNYFTTAVLLCGVCLIFAYLATQIPSLAGAVGGGLGMAAMNVRQGVAAGTAVANLAGSPISGTRNFLAAKSNRMDHKSPTGLQTQSSRAEHMAMGRTVLNSQYRTALKERMRSTWSRNTVSKN